MENFFQKNFFEFFVLKIFFLESRTMPKNSKRGHSGSLNVFTNRKLQKNARGYPLTESENFRKKSRIVPKKTGKKSNERSQLRVREKKLTVIIEKSQSICFEKNQDYSKTKISKIVHSARELVTPQGTGRGFRQQPWFTRILYQNYWLFAIF